MKYAFGNSKRFLLKKKFCIFTVKMLDVIQKNYTLIYFT